MGTTVDNQTLGTMVEYECSYHYNTPRNKRKWLYYTQLLSNTIEWLQVLQVDTLTDTCIQIKKSLIKELKNTNIYNNTVAACEKSTKYELPLIF